MEYLRIKCGWDNKNYIVVANIRMLYIQTSLIVIALIISIPKNHVLHLLKKVGKKSAKNI